MFILAREFAHVWYGASAVFDLANLQPADVEIESVCNQAAAEFLAPEDEVLQACPVHCTKLPAILNSLKLGRPQNAGLKPHYKKRVLFVL